VPPDPEQTSQQRLEDAVLVARRLAHLYSNVMTSILGFTEMALGQLPGSSTARRSLDVAFRGAQQGVGLTRRLHLLGCKAAKETQGVPLKPVLSRQLGRRASPGKEVEEIVDVHDSLPLIALSQEQLSAVLESLLDNAHEAVETEGRVVISARGATLRPDELAGLMGRPQAGACVCLEVADSGTGMSPEANLRLFREPFFTSKPRHHGLGLTIVHSILSVQQGGFCLTRNPAGGTVARAYLPLMGSANSAPSSNALPTDKRTKR
jgi:signal transduction histidine kinase